MTTRFFLANTMKRRSVPLIALVGAFAWLGTMGSPPTLGQVSPPGCYTGTTSTGQSGCNKAPISMPCIDITQPFGPPDSFGLENDSGNLCGFTRFLIFAVSCGNYQGEAICF
jgi:hypothetical protein